MLNFDVQEGLEGLYCDDIYYEFFDGGFIDPEKFLKNQEDIDKVNEAREIVRCYFRTLEQNDLLES